MKTRKYPYLFIAAIVACLHFFGCAVDAGGIPPEPTEAPPTIGHGSPVLPTCPDTGSRSVLLVDCGAGRMTCRGSIGDILFSGCMLDDGSGPAECVERCNP